MALSELFFLSPLHAICPLSAAGVLIYLLDLFCNSTEEQVRLRTSEVMARMMADKLVGPRIRIVLAKFLPALFLDAMRDGPSEAVALFEREREKFPSVAKKDEIILLKFIFL